MKLNFKKWLSSPWTTFILGVIFGQAFAVLSYNYYSNLNFERDLATDRVKLFYSLQNDVNNFERCQRKIDILKSINASHNAISHVKDTCARYVFNMKNKINNWPFLLYSDSIDKNLLDKFSSFNLSNVTMNKEFSALANQLLTQMHKSVLKDENRFWPMKNNPQQSPVENVYQNQVKKLIPNALDYFNKHLNTYGACIITDNDTTPDTLAKKIVFYQYGDRYCSLVGGKSITEHCKALTRITSSTKNNKSLQTDLALCEIATKRAQHETQNNQQKFNHLSWDTYYSQHLKPLISQQRAIVKQQLKTSISTHAFCKEPWPLPKTRDPQGDALFIAYSIVSDEVCGDS